MKKLSETNALDELQKLKTDFQEFIRTNYEHRAMSCATCSTKGACCLDAHFVNIHITRLEAMAIRQTLKNLDQEARQKIYRRVRETIEKYDLKSAGDSFRKTFACPLFEKEIGCLVHAAGKPAPCIAHACYERQEDLPPDEFQEEVEIKIERLNRQTYGANAVWLPLPVWIDLLNSSKNKTAQNNKESAR